MNQRINQNRNLVVIILNYNDAQNTIRYVNEIKKYKCIDRIIIVDNQSPDQSLEKLEALKNKKIDVIQTEANLGYAYGNNYAIRYANQTYGEFKYIAISNPDVSVPEKSYEECLQCLENNDKIAIAAPRMYDLNNHPHPLSGWKLRTIRGDTIDSSPSLNVLYRQAHVEMYEKEYLNQKKAVVDCVAGSFFLIRHSVFKKVGYFDEKTFLYFEEDILGNKIHQLGYKNVVLNTCKFNHFESVSVDKSMNSMKKYKNLQKSKRYYHKTYNEEANKLYQRWKIWILDFVTFFHPIEEKIHLERFCNRIRNTHFSEYIVLGIKLLILLIQIVLYPFTYLMKKCRKKEKVLYFSLVTWKWIKQRPHFVALELAKNPEYQVDYRYQSLYDKYMPKDDNSVVKNEVNVQSKLKIKPFKIFPANTRWKIFLNSAWNIIRTSFWNYDKIILTQPNQMDFFFMKVQKLKRVKFYYEAMDNYEVWEPNVLGYLDKQRRLIQCASHLIVSAEALKEKFMKMYQLDESFCTVIRNGYDKTTFENYKKVKTPIHHPSVSYIGTIDEWFDFKNVIAYARKHHNITFYVIGPINKKIEKKIKKIKEKNIIFPGPIEHKEVPQYIQDSDVMIMPFLINDVIKYVDPVKIYEYLYMKKPIVSSYWDELVQFDGLVYFYKKEEDFEKMLDTALKTTFVETANYKKIINESTWENRLKEYWKVIK